MSSSSLIAVYLVPVYILLFSLCSNLILAHNSPQFKNRLSQSPTVTSRLIRYCSPYPLCTLGLPPALPTLPSTTSTRTRTRSSSNTGGTLQSDRSRPVTFGARFIRGIGLGGTSDTGSNNAASSDPLGTILADRTRTGTRPTGTPVTAASGRSGGNATASTPGTNPTTPASNGRVITRGGRRWGRTGSQRSTKTLPLYSEDVGEEDVVLIRKRESLRQAGRGEEGDIAEQAGEYGSDLEEEEEESGGIVHEGVERDETTPPIVEPESTTEAELVDRSQTQEGRDRSSSGTWGEAPSYDTAVPPPSFDFNDLEAGNRLHSVDLSDSRPAVYPPVRERGFRAFVGRLTGRGEERTEEDGVGLVRGRTRGWSNASSAGTSQASLLLQPTMTRFSTRRSSIGGLGFGSAASSSTHLPLVTENQISSPVPGTVIRSSFDAPRKGFSAEQVKFLSSTESLGKFGVRLDEAGNHVVDENQGGRRRAGSVGVDDGPMDRRTRSRAASDAPNTLTPGWRDLAREEQEDVEQAGTGTVTPRPLSLALELPVTPNRPTRLALGRPGSVPGVEIEIVPPTPV